MNPDVERALDMYVAQLENVTSLARGLGNHDEASTAQLKAVSDLFLAVKQLDAAALTLHEQRGAACFVCSGRPHADTTDAGGHAYWSTASALAEARAHDRQVLAAGGPVYPSGARSAEAAYVDQHRPY